MQVTETLAEGLKREFKVVVPGDRTRRAALDAARHRSRTRSASRASVPARCRSAISAACSASRRWPRSSRTSSARSPATTLTERGERAAMQPDFKLPEDETEADKVLAGEADLTYTMTYEVLPKVELGDFKTHLGRAAGRRGLRRRGRRASSSGSPRATRSFTPKEGEGETGDRLTISYVGKIDGEPFEGGSDENAIVRLGSSQFIPGFAEQLDGVTTGEEKTITVTFPEDYGATISPARPRPSTSTVKEVAAPDGADDRRRAREAARPRSRSRSSATPSASRSQSQYGKADAPEGEAPAPRPARRACTRSSCRRRWSSRSSRTSGGRSPPS